MTNHTVVRDPNSYPVLFCFVILFPLHAAISGLTLPTCKMGTITHPFPALRVVQERVVRGWSDKEVFWQEVGQS